MKTTIKKTRLTVEFDNRRDEARQYMAHIEIFHEPGTASDEWHVGEAADYKTAILRAADIWQTAAGEPILRTSRATAISSFVTTTDG